MEVNRSDQRSTTSKSVALKGKAKSKLARLLPRAVQRNVVYGTPILNPLLPLVAAVLDKDASILRAGLAHGKTAYCPTKLKDATWGCGYRNTQHVLSALAAIDSQRYEQNFSTTSTLPIKDIQMRIEDAWRKGFDTEGAAQLQHKLVDKHKWIGTTEVYAFLTGFGYDCSIFQFTGPNRGKHLVQYCLHYFVDKEDDPLAGRVAMTGKAPLYFQHQGHSRTIVGVLITNKGTQLIVFDPAKRLSKKLRRYQDISSPDVGKDLQAADLSAFILQETDLKHKEYQLLVVTPLRLDNQELSNRKIIRPRNM